MPNDLSPDEMRMRAALGLRDQHREPGTHQGEPSPQRRRFAREGEIAVTVINSARSVFGSGESPRSRLLAAEEALKTEQSRHAHTKRALDDALAAIKALETKYAHAELAHTEAIAQEQSARAQAETTLKQRDAQLGELARRARQLEAQVALQPQMERAANAAVRTAKRSKVAPSAVEAEPVKWWLPSSRSAKRGR